MLSLLRPMLPSVGGFAISSNGYFSNLQVTRTGVKSWTSLKFGHIVQFILELLALTAEKHILDLVQGIRPSVLIATY